MPSYPTLAPLLSSCCFALAVSGTSAQTLPTGLPFQDPELPAEQRIDDLIGRMTLEEKIDCMAMRAAVPRLGVKGSRHIEGYHGVAQGGPSNWGRRNPTATTQFPQAYGLGATWDPELIRQVAAQEAEEARYLFQSPRYDRAGLIVRAPNADLARDPRWGRTEEVYGEDPFHAGTLATAFVRGLQGDDPRYFKAVSLVKHFLANSNEDGRESSSSNFSERQWREYYAKPFEMAIVDGGAPALMAAYNAVNGTPAHVHPMLRDIVMAEWKLNGILCTDGGGLRLLVEKHHAFPDLPSAAAACVKAGINHFLDRHKDAVTEAVARGSITERDLDAALRGLFRVSLKLGLLDPDERVPYAAIGRNGEAEPWLRPDTQALVRKVTQRSIVLLKNSGALLPLDRTKVKTVALVGPLVNTVLPDWYGGTPPYTVPPSIGVEKVAGEGVKVGWLADMGDAAVELARTSEIAIVCVGNDPISAGGWELVRTPSEGKEAVDRKDLALPRDQEKFIRRVLAANPRTIVVLISNFPYAMPWVVKHVPAIVHLTHASQELGHALGDVLWGEVNPDGKLAQTWPKSLKQLPPMMDYDLTHGRTYQYFKGEPQFPFGFGLSYTTFNLSNLRVGLDVARHVGAGAETPAESPAPRTFAPNAILSIAVEVTNTGTRAGDEVVQVYARYPHSKVSRPLKQLCGFQRISVAAGETAHVRLQLPASRFAYWSVEQHAWVVEPGPVELLVGNSSADSDLKLRQTISIE
ncbi:glycoside hydrolase family 3 C-terminal domain-containing protein [Opitutus terrae]|uniref:Glycoside hydrolase family 3 domain protein n=1 Tax=Opitutus terrae (strain DSM 11246 / JCM 15787 / PB90-1) TaxID=452637 RepID=B1ZU62_OPITP|nr:glycoside hydrolase family 3 C-terminal domain-containing protein [Opitutus terrae]ACB76628.1 glycoside hydrolase family 3 domain protein [Opitutus terrae PB90-1]